VQRLAELRATGQVAVAIEVDERADGLAPAVMRDVRAVVEAHPGAAALELRWRGRDGAAARLRSALSVSPAGGTLLELRSLLGPERVRLVRAS
jgi:hypothetical protein